MGVLHWDTYIQKRCACFFLYSCVCSSIDIILPTTPAVYNETAKIVCVVNQGLTGSKGAAG